MRARPRVIGVGCRDRGDDAAGLVVARGFEDEAEVVLCERGGPDLLGALEGATEAVVVDAMVGAGPPGTVRAFLPDELPSDVAFCSSHVFGLPAAIAVARELGALPPRLLVVGIEGESFELHAPLSATVERAVPEARARVRAWLSEGRTS